MARYWTYTPNQYTTSMTFTVTFSGGGSAMFTYTLTGGEWTFSSGSTDGLTVIGTSALVKIYDNGSVKRIQCVCSNSAMSHEAQDIRVKRIHFLEVGTSLGQIEPGIIYGLGAGNGQNNMWNPEAVEDRNDISLTNLTETITLPGIKTGYSQGMFAGWAILNPTVNPIVGSSDHKASAFWHHLTSDTQYYGSGGVQINAVDDWRIVTRDGKDMEGYTDPEVGPYKPNYEGFKDILSFDSVDDTYYLAFPVINNSTAWNYYDVDTDGGEPRSLQSIYAELNPDAAQQVQ